MNRITIAIIQIVLTLSKHWYAMHADRLNREEENDFLDNIACLRDALEEYHES